MFIVSVEASRGEDRRGRGATLREALGAVGWPLAKGAVGRVVIRWEASDTIRVGAGRTMEEALVGLVDEIAL